MSKQVKPSQPEDPLKACVLDLLNQGGRSEEEATAWCKDFLAMGGKDSEPESIDSANVREAERIMLDARENLMKPREMENCTRNRQALFGEGEFEAARRCRADWEMGERVRGLPMDATDMVLLDPPESFHRLAVLRLRLDSRTSDLLSQRNCRTGASLYTPERADRKARQELGLPQVYPKKPEPQATVPDLYGKSKEEIIKGSVAADAKRGSGTVPDLYGKSHDQVVKEVLAQDEEDKKR